MGKKIHAGGAGGGKDFSRPALRRGSPRARGAPANSLPTMGIALRFRERAFLARNLL
jgi:hypothetical protein